MSKANSALLSDATLHQVSLRCNDLADSKDFYENTLGATLIADFDPPGLLFFKFGVTRLLLDKNGKPGLVYIRVNNLEDKVSALKEEGVVFESDIQAVFEDKEGLFGNPGDTEFMAFFKDPSDNLLALVEQKPAE